MWKYRTKGQGFDSDGEPRAWLRGQIMRRLWRDDRGTMSLAAWTSEPPQPLVLESRWTAAGAACLDRPRVDAHWTALGEQTFGADLYDQVRSHCPTQMPPPCGDHGFELDGFHLLTASVPRSRPQP